MQVCWSGGRIRRSRFAKARIIDPRVDLDLFGIEGLLDIRPGLPWSIRNGKFQSLDLAKSEKKDSQGTSWSPVFRTASHFKSRNEEASISTTDISIFVCQFHR